MTSKSLTVRALQVKQDKKTPLYSFFIKAKEILAIADITRIRKSDQDNAILGYQRGVVQSHVNEIAEYLNAGDVLFPNSIIMAMCSEVKFKQSRGPQVGDPDCNPGTLDIPLNPEGKKAAWIVDGQQRTMALMQSKSHSIMVPMTGFVSNDFDVHRAQFLLVNKAKPLPNGLINELLPEVNTTLPSSLSKNRMPSALCNILNQDPESPFKGLIIRQTTDRKKDKTAVVTDNALMQVIRQSLRNVNGCLYQYSNVATGEIDAESIRKVLNIYWGAVKETFPEAWGLPSKRSRLMHGVGIKAMGSLMDRVMTTILPSDERAMARVVASLRGLKPHCAWTQGSWEKLNGIPWNFLQNTGRDVNLLSNMLIRQYTGVE